MDVKLALGAEVDIASGKELDGLRDDIGGMFDKHRPVRPMYMTQVGSRAITDPFTGIIDVGMPPAGRIWNVLGYAIVGNSDASPASAGTAALYIGDLPTTGVPTLAQVKSFASAVPFGATFGENVMWCPAPQHVFFSLAAVAGLTQFVANVFIAEYRADDLIQRTGR